ncbi:chaperone NapD [Thalassotalea maritima]|uniref:chaperone NapD n=1 Tax=Thalassotalea maritima TaxID=3242416 RepID=UPI003526CDE0
MNVNKEYHVASFVSQIDPGAKQQATEAIESIPGAEIHITSETGKVVFTIEADNHRVIGQFADELKLQPGILTVAPVYHQYLQE